MAFPRNLLNEGEEMILDLRPHWLYLAPATTALVAAVILGIVSLALSFAPYLQVAVGVIVLVALGYFAVRYLIWTTTNFGLTTDRLITRRGVLSKRGVEIPLERINTVFYEQSLFERMVGAGDLAVESAGERGNETFTDVRKPAIVQKEIYVQMEANENRKFDRAGARDPAPAPATPAPPSAAGDHLGVPEQIEKLAELHQRGMLSDEEFATKKTELLGRM